MDLFANLKRRLHIGPVSRDDSPATQYINTLARALLDFGGETDSVTLQREAPLPAWTDEMRQCLQRHSTALTYDAVIKRLKTLCDLQAFTYETVKTSTFAVIVGAVPHTFRMTVQPHDDAVELERVL